MFLKKIREGTKPVIGFSVTSFVLSDVYNYDGLLWRKWPKNRHLTIVKLKQQTKLLKVDFVSVKHYETLSISKNCQGSTLENKIQCFVLIWPSIRVTVPWVSRNWQMTTNMTVPVGVARVSGDIEAFTTRLFRYRGVAYVIPAKMEWKCPDKSKCSKCQT